MTRLPPIFISRLPEYDLQDTPCQRMTGPRLASCSCTFDEVARYVGFDETPVECTAYLTTFILCCSVAPFWCFWACVGGLCDLTTSKRFLMWSCYGWWVVFIVLNVGSLFLEWYGLLAAKFITVALGYILLAAPIFVCELLRKLAGQLGSWNEPRHASEAKPAPRVGRRQPWHDLERAEDESQPIQQAVHEEGLTEDATTEEQARNVARAHLKPWVDHMCTELKKRLDGPPNLSSMVWQWFLLSVYTGYPPRDMSAAAVRDHIAHTRRIRPGSPEVLTALKKVQVSYHPDKNRPAVFGAEWAVRAEEIAKMANQLATMLKQKPAYNIT